GTTMDAGMSQFFSNLLPQLPVFVVFGVGAYMAWHRRPSQPQAARLTCLALGMLFVTAVVMTWVYGWLPRYGTAQGWSATEFQMAFKLVSVIRNIIEAVGLALLLRAIFASPTPALAGPALSGPAPVLASPAPARPHGCLGVFLGGVLGA